MTPNQTSPTFRFAIDGNEANVSNRVGSNVYAFELLKSLHRQLKRHPEILVTVLLSGPPQADLPAPKLNWRYQIITPAKLWTQWALPLHLFWHKADYDVLFTPGHYAPRVSAIPYISSVMDLAFLHYPDAFAKKDYLQLKAWTAYSVKHAAKVVAISEFTKQEIRRMYRKRDTDIIVATPSTAHLNLHYNQREFAKFCLKHAITQPYILYMGTLQPRKNLVKLIEAFEQVVSETLVPANAPRSGKRPTFPLGKLKLVLAGKVGWLAEEIIHKIAHSPLKDRIILTGFVPNAFKTPLYANATGVVMLSAYEGFGIPALEAMAAGTLPIVANSSSLPEVVGEAGIMVNPDQVGSIANGLLQAFYLSAKERAMLKKLGREQVTTFSWDRSAKIILTELIALAESTR